VITPNTKTKTPTQRYNTITTTNYINLWEMMGRTNIFSTAQNACCIHLRQN